MSTTTASVLTQQLTRYGVTHVFGIPGVHTLELYRGLANTPIQHVTPRHEQGAGFMADGYARESRKPGVCFIISGPGMTNILTAMGQAYSESIPMLVVSSVNSQGRMGSGDGWLHELSDQQTLVKGVCAFSHTLHHPDEIHQVLARAFAIFDSQRPRPVHIEIPINVLNAPCAPQPNSATEVLRLNPPRACLKSMQHAARQLVNATKPVLLVGGGATHAGTPIVNLAEHLDSPVVMTVNARGVVPHYHALAVAASASLPAVRKLIADADVVLAIGTEMGSTDYDVNEDGLFKLTAQFIRIDLDAQQLVRNQIPQVGLIGDSATTAEELLQAMAHQPTLPSSGASRAAIARDNALASLTDRYKQYVDTLNTIRDTLPDVMIIGDSTQIIYAGNCAFGTNQPASYVNSAMGFGTLGYALPAAIGAAVANPQRAIVAISGDGGLQFCLSELATAVDENLKLTLIVHENGGYHEIENFMQANHIKPVGVKLMVPKLCEIAIACGWQCSIPESLNQLADRLLTASEATLPTLIIIHDALFDKAPE